MNIALGALIILLLLLPALFFRLGIFMVRGGALSSQTAADNFSREQVKKNFINILSKFNFSETLFFFSIIPLLLHVISLWVLSFLGYDIDYEQLMKLFSSNVGIAKKNTPFPHELSSFLIYNFVEALIGFFMGWLVTSLIMNRPGLLRNLAGDNIWFKLFTGVLLKENTRKKVTAILVDVLCETKEATVVYSGFLEKFDVNENKQIEYITLTTTTRRDLREGSQVTETPAAGNVPGTKSTVILVDNGPITPVAGKYFTIPGSKILNVNVSYMHYGDKPDPNDPTKKIKGWSRLE